ncbi:hypothetical protein Dimus_012843 [Dionaea muscipula]
MAELHDRPGSGSQAWRSTGFTCPTEHEGRLSSGLNAELPRRPNPAMHGEYTPADLSLVLNMSRPPHLPAKAELGGGRRPHQQAEHRPRAEKAELGPEQVLPPRRYDRRAHPLPYTEAGHEEDDSKRFKTELPSASPPPSSSGRTSHGRALTLPDGQPLSSAATAHPWPSSMHG